MNAALLLVFVQIVCGAHGPGEYNVCLSCPRVSHPRECQTFVEIWPEEKCYTQMLLLMNGSRVYEFGHETPSSCSQSDLQESTLDRGRRQISSTDIVMCYECCSESLCNRKICGIPGSNSTNLACLFGEDVSGFPPDTSITYCNEGEYCYARRTQRRARPHMQNYDYGCAPQVVCDHFARVSAGSSTICQRCCSEDGCNAHICHEQVPGSTTLPIDTTQSTLLFTRHVPGSTILPIDTTQSTPLFTRQVPGTTTSTIDTTQSTPLFTRQVPGSTTLPINTTQSTGLFTDCWDLRTRGGYQQNAVYDIYPPPAHSRLRVRCDMTTDGGGWIVVQKRYDGSLNFTRTFQEYEEGFRDVSGEHWLGLRWIHLLTSPGAVQMRVDLCRVDGRAGYAVYDEFSVSGPGDNYTLHAGVYRTGSIPDWLRNHNGRVFQVSSWCAERYRGGWWYVSCFNANLNGGRYKGGSNHGIVWDRFGGHASYPNVRSSELKIRPINAPGDPTHPYTCSP